MGITSDKNSQPPKESKGRSYFGDLPKIIEECIELFGEDDPLTLEYKQELIDLTKLKQQRENNPNHYEEEEEEWHAGMVPNLRPKSEKGLEEEETQDDDWEEDPEDEDEDPADSSNPDPEASKAEPDLSPMSKAGGDPT